MSKRMWMVRAAGGYSYEEFVNNSVIALGWKKIGKINNNISRDDLYEKLRKNYTGMAKNTYSHWAGQITRFMNEFEKGEYVLTYDPENREYSIGTISSDYYYKEGIVEDMPRLRDVKWLAQISRDKLSVNARNKLGAISTIFEVHEDAKKELLELLKNSDADFADDEEYDEAEEIDEETEEMDTIREDIIEKANEFIKDKVAELEWQDMERLVAGILRGMGYKTMITERGADRGRDIKASPDGLGLEDPRIVAEVKHRSNQMGAPEIRSFIGGLRSGDKGLYVSTGGFSKEAKYEAERSTLPITLIDLDRLVALLVQYYEKLDGETKALVPLTKIFWPV